jgi:hypothetical protein
MDPNANLEELRRLLEALRSRADAADWEWSNLDQCHKQIGDAARVADLVEALDEWLSRGGFLPKAWERPTYQEALSRWSKT